jgi:hypothetical protein
VCPRFSVLAERFRTNCAAFGRGPVNRFYALFVQSISFFIALLIGIDDAGKSARYRKVPVDVLVGIFSKYAGERVPPNCFKYFETHQFSS